MLHSKQLYKLIWSAAFISLLVACGPGKKEKDAALVEKKEQVEKLRADNATNEATIAQLEKEIIELDPSLKQEATPFLVAVDTITKQDFSHYIELQGKVDANDISYITPRAGPGQIQALYIKKGDIVRKGQLVAKLDDRLIKQQIEPIKTQLTLAKDIYQRRQNLWQQSIGSEIELISARTNVEQLERQIDLLNEQVKTTSVLSNVQGFVDEVNVKIGELFTGAGQIKVVNTSSLKAVTNVPENYLSRMSRGSKVLVQIPDINKNYNSTINFISATIDPYSRSFTIEAKLPSDANLKPNLVTIMKILDYSAPNAVAVPVNIVQSDEKGKYIFTLSNEQGKMIARKKQIVVGQLQNDVVEIKAGLQSGDIIVTQGYQGLYDGQLITIQ